jgi:hypothetical protein
MGRNIVQSGFCTPVKTKKPNNTVLVLLGFNLSFSRSDEFMQALQFDCIQAKIHIINGAGNFVDSGISVI